MGVTEVLAQNTGIVRAMLQEYYSDSNINIEYNRTGQKAANKGSSYMWAWERAEWGKNENDTTEWIAHDSVSEK